MEKAEKYFVLGISSYNKRIITELSAKLKTRRASRGHTRGPRFSSGQTTTNVGDYCFFCQANRLSLTHNYGLIILTINYGSPETLL